jgi:hypothetical protein
MDRCFGILLNRCAPATNIAGIPNALGTRGPVSSVIASEWWIQFALGMVVYVGVVEILYSAVGANGLHWQFLVIVWVPLFFTLYIAPRIL